MHPRVTRSSAPSWAEAAARDALEDTLTIEGPPLFSRVFRWERQSPQYEVGHLQRVHAIDRRTAAIPGLFLAGSGFRAIGIPHCIADGRDAAGLNAEYLATEDGTDAKTS